MADKSIWTRMGEGLGFATPTIEAPANTADQVIAKVAPTQTLGSSNVADIGGYVVSLDRNPRFSGENRYTFFDEMVRDTTIVAAGVRLFLNLLASAEWTVNPAEDQEGNPRAQEIADQCYDMLFDMTSSWSTVVRKTAMYRFQGFSILEHTAKKRTDGSIGFMDIENRPQRSIIRWNRDKSGTVEEIVQRLVAGGEAVLPRSKVVYAVDDTLTDSPEGLGLFRHLAVTAERLKTFMELEEVGFETDLRGIPIARAPLTELRKEVEDSGPSGSTARASAEARRRGLIQPMRDFIDRHIRNKKTGVMLPSDTYASINPDKATSPTSVYKWMLELLNGDASSFGDIANAINRMNQELARVLGVEHLLLGADGTGSLALAQSKVGTFYLTVTATLSDLVEVFERDVIGPLALLNGWPPELVPSLGVGEVSDQDIEMVARVLASLSTAGATLMPNDPAVGEIRDRLGLSRPPEETDMPGDASLNPRRNEPGTADPEGNPEDEVAKRRMIWSRRSIARRRRASELKKAA